MKLNGIVSNLTVSGNINAKNRAAGIIGRLNGEVNNCVNNCNIISEGYVGGIVAQSTGATIMNCINTGNLESKGWSAGGILGEAYSDVYIINCCNRGNIATGATVVSYGYACGIVGNANKLKEISNCYTTGMLTAARNNRRYAIGGKSELMKNVYYLDNQQEDIIIENGVNVKDEKYMKSSEFLNELNSNIDGDNRLKEWKKGEDGFPSF